MDERPLTAKFALHSARRRSVRVIASGVPITAEGIDMTPAAFKAWRKAARLSQAAAARALGVSPRMVFAYEHNEKPVPLTIRLACAAYALGLRDYDGPEHG